MADLVDRIITDKTQAIEYVSTNGYKLNEVSEELKKDKDVVLAAVNANLSGEQAFAYASLDLKYNKDFMLEVLAIQPMSLEHFEAPFQDNLHIVKMAVSRDAYSIQFGSPRLRENKQLVLLAIKQDEQALDFISSQLLEKIGQDNPVENLEGLIKAEKLSKKLNKELENKSHKKKLKL